MSVGDMAIIQEMTQPLCSPQGPTSPVVPSSYPSTYLGSSCVEGDAQQGAKPQTRGHGESHKQDPSQAHSPLGLGAVPSQHGDTGIGQLEEHSKLAGTGRLRRASGEQRERAHTP